MYFRLKSVALESPIFRRTGQCPLSPGRSFVGKIPTESRAIKISPTKYPSNHFAILGDRMKVTDISSWQILLSSAHCAQGRQSVFSVAAMCHDSLSSWQSAGFSRSSLIARTQ